MRETAARAPRLHCSHRQRTMKPVFVGGSLSFKGDKKAKKKNKSKAKHSVKSPTTDPESISRAAAAGGANDADDAAVDGMTTPRAPASHDEDNLLEADLTEAERKALTKRRERELQELAVLATKSHRERVEEFNEKLASLTEHNDIPRVRADRRLCVFFFFYSWPLANGTRVFSLLLLFNISPHSPVASTSSWFVRPFVPNQVSAAGNG
jgi:protein FAM32A